uniref:Uncharacterized protein n=1 Tax=Lepeophtheirus salmonis TaxID=72036 RepID=A0A0K2TVX2_LEPSM
MAAWTSLSGILQSELKGIKNEVLVTLDNKSEKETSKTDMDKEINENKNAKAEKKRAKEEARYQKERQKSRIDGQYKREKLREEMRQKYGLSKPSSDCTDYKAVESVQKDYKMSEKECAELERRMHEQLMEKKAVDRKVEKKLDKRKKKKDLKENVKGVCTTQ